MEPKLSPGGLRNRVSTASVFHDCPCGVFAPGGVLLLGHFFEGLERSRDWNRMTSKSGSARDGAWTLIRMAGGDAACASRIGRARSHAGQDSSPPDQSQDCDRLDAARSPGMGSALPVHGGAQGHPSFPAEYTGPNSLTPGAEIKDTISVDVMGGVRLWRGGEFFGDVVIWQGYGLSNTLGMAGFPNGEAFRIGRTYPDAYLCRAYIRETIGFGGEKEAADDARRLGRHKGRSEPDVYRRPLQRQRHLRQQRLRQRLPIPVHELVPDGQ